MPAHRDGGPASLMSGRDSKVLGSNRSVQCVAWSIFYDAVAGASCPRLLGARSRRYVDMRSALAMSLRSENRGSTTVVH